MDCWRVTERRQQLAVCRGQARIVEWIPNRQVVVVGCIRGAYHCRLAPGGFRGSDCAVEDHGVINVETEAGCTRELPSCRYAATSVSAPGRSEIVRPWVGRRVQKDERARVRRTHLGDIEVAVYLVCAVQGIRV